MNETPENNTLIAKWLVDDLTTEEKEQLEVDDSWQDLRIVVDDVAEWSLPAFDTEGELKKLQTRKEQVAEGPKVIRFNAWLRVAAAIAILLTSGYFGWDYYFNSEIEITTGLAETREVMLPDNSKVNLDARSTLTYSKRGWGEERHVRLAGQAFFDIQKGPSFMVETENGNVSVLGTQFNLRSETGVFAVQCYEGKVKITSEGQEAILTAGEAVELIDGKLEKSTHTGRQPEWLSGYTVYEDALLKTVVKDLQRYYEVDIKLPGKYKRLKFTGKVPHENLEQALKTIFLTLEIPYSLNEGRVVFN